MNPSYILIVRLEKKIDLYLLLSPGTATWGLGALMVLGAVLSGLFAPGSVTQGELVLSEEPDEVWFEDVYDGEEQGLVFSYWTNVLVTVCP